MMKLLSTLLIFLFGSWVATPPPQPLDPPTPAVTYTFHEDSEMTIYGSSNLRDWTMDVLVVDGQVAVQPAADDGLPTIERVLVEVPIDSVLSERGSQNEKAHKALKKKRQPVIYFRSESVNVAAGSAADSTFSITAEGELIMAGERRTVTVQSEGTRLANGAYRFQGEHDLLMSDFDIERPTALLGALRVTDEIRVAYDVTIVPN
jgi:hypothetical protein